MNTNKSIFDMSKEEIIAAGLIGLCYECDEISAFTDKEHFLMNETLSHWYTGEEFTENLSNLWLVQYGPKGITGCNLIQW